jgi:hypothetical protein
VVAGQRGPSLTVPSCRATTRAAARSPAHGTSVKLVVPKELHSSTARNTAPYPDGRVGPGATVAVVSRSPSRPSSSAPPLDGL